LNDLHIDLISIASFVDKAGLILLLHSGNTGFRAEKAKQNPV